MTVGFTSATSLPVNSASNVLYSFTDSGEANQAIVLIEHASGGISRTLDAIALAGVSGTIFNTISADGGQFSRQTVCVWKESELPTFNGNKTINVTYSGGINQHQITLYYLHGVDQTTPLSGFLSNSAINQTSPHTISTTQASNAGKFGIASFGYADETSPPSGTSNFALSANQTEVADFANTAAVSSKQAMGAGYDALIASSSELFDADCSHSADMDAVTALSFIVEAAVLITGTLSEALDSTTSTAFGEVGILGALSETLEDTTSDASGLLPIVGSLSETLDGASSTGSGVLDNLGSLSETLDNVESAASSILSNEGSLSETLEDTSSISSGILEIIGTVSDILDNVTAASNGILNNTGNASISLDGASSVSEGILLNSGTLSITLEDTGVVSLAVLTNKGNIPGTTADVSSTAAGLLANGGSLSVTLENVSSAGTGLLDNQGALAETLEDVASISSALLGYKGSVDVTLESVTISSFGVVYRLNTSIERTLQISETLPETSISDPLPILTLKTG